MKVLYIITKANWGGAQRYVYDLAVAAKARGLDVAVAHGGGGLMATRLTEAGVRTIPVAGLGRDVSGSDLTAYRSLARIIRTEHPDVVHLNSSKTGALGAVAARVNGVQKIVFTSHGWAFNESRPFPIRAVIWLISWFTSLCATNVVAVSDSELRSAQRMPFCKHKAVRIYNGIDLQMHFGDGEVIRKAFPQGVKITGTVGELTKNKNQIALVEEAKQKPGMYVAIVGEGELRPMLEQKIKEYGLESRVKLFGFIPSSEVMKGFDLFALPSIKEGLGYVLIEARAAGLPITSNRVGGTGEALDTDLREFSVEKMINQTIALY